MKQDRLQKYYNTFIKRDVPGFGLKINIRPITDDIPKELSVGIDPRNKSFNIEFNIGHENNMLEFAEGPIEVYVGVNSKRIARITVKNADKLREIIVEIESIVDKFKTRYQNTINKVPTLKEKLRELGNYDIIERQLTESQEILESAAQGVDKVS